MANGKQPELAIAPANNTSSTQEPGNDCSNDNTYGGSAGEHGMATGNTRQESIDASSARDAVDFELLWRLRKYLVLLGILAVSVTYNAGLTPPGGFWSDNTENEIDGHYAGDPVLRALFFPRHEVFFYCNATAFASSLVLIILLLSKNVTRQKLWLRSMQLTMILDLFSLMGAYAAGCCRAVKSSIYIWALVFAVFVYIMVHILFFKFISGKRFVPEWLKVKMGFILDWIQSKCVNKSQRRSPQEINNAETTKREENDLEEARKFILMLVTFAATVTYQAGLSPPGGFWAENDQNKQPGTSILRSENLARYNTFVIWNSTSFVASLVTVILLLSPELSRHGIRSKAVSVCVIVDLLALIGAYAAGSCRSVETSVCVILITVAVWICFALLAAIFVHKPVVAWLKMIEPGIEKCMHTIGRVLSLEARRIRNISRNREGDNIANSQQSAGCETDPMQPESASESKHQVAYHHQVPINKEGESNGEHHTASTHQTANTTESVSCSGHALMSDEPSQNKTDGMHSLEDHSTHCGTAAKEPTSNTENLSPANRREQSSSTEALKIPNPPVKVTISKTENLLTDEARQKSSLRAGLETTNPVDDTSHSEHQSTDCEQVGNMTGQYSSIDDHKPTIMAVEDISQDSNGATNDLTAEKESADVSREAIEIEIQIESEIVETNDRTRPLPNGNIGKNEQPPNQGDSNKNAGGDRTDEHLKKSRTYLLLLAILAVSLTYQSGLNPSGGFWSTEENNNMTGDPILNDNHHRPYHLPGDPILEDTHHRRYIAFFYLNAVAFVASLVMIIMLLNRRMSNKVIKRYALQTVMIVDLLALTGSYVMASCRKTSSIYISLLVCLVLAYVSIHVLIAIHVIPEWCKEAAAEKLESFSCRYICTKQIPPSHKQRGDAEDKDCELGRNKMCDTIDKDKVWERRRNLLLMLAVLAATVTYQAGMNPPGGVWSDDTAVSGIPGDPILQHNNSKRYDVFYYSNSLSFVSSVVITILLVNKASCEHGIKSYALRVCLVVGLVGLLVAYSAGSCRKAKDSIYLIIIAVAVLSSLVIQVLLLSSTQDTLRGPTGKSIERLFQLFVGKEEAWRGTNSKQKESSDHPKEKDRKKHKYLILLAILAASITYQAGLNPPGGIWSADEGHVSGNPVLLDIHPRRYKVFFWFNSISLMTSIVVIMFLLNKSVREKDVPLWVLHIIMVFDLLALMTAFAAGSCRKFRTSVYVYALVVGVVIYLVIAIFVSSGIAKYLRSKSKEQSGRSPNRTSGTNTAIARRQD
ncbi:hypothetical protein BS78_K050400 [Paspalum vaginatum]|uniref:PGG domain-containing protein n=1 Tax=Paspalum vaginatum TaxID=158149 RepID=A0A9W8CD96_9POAL|nr:hypothetical protein BS78_K050400 [Paspalum vaginatum]